MNKVFIEKPRRAALRKKEEASKLLPFDKSLLALSAAFILGGLIFTYSSSAFDSMAYFKRQVIFDVLGVIIMLTLAQFYGALQKLFKPVYLLFITWGLLIWALLLPEAANVHRWISLGFFNLQPSEVAKAVLIIYLAAFLSKKKDIGADNTQLITPVAYTLITIGLIVAGKDLGIPALMFAVAVAVFFIAGAPVSKMFYVFAAMAPLVIVEFYRHPYRIKRLTSFMSPEDAAGSIGYQLVHSFYAIGSGGWFGKGLGASDLKLEYLPAAHTDFIFAIMCEEIGMIGAFIIIAGFVWLLVRGITIARGAKSAFNSYLSAGITICLALQAFVNMSVACGLLPTKGLPLPFFSYGGSSVIVTLAMMGILMNIAAEEAQQAQAQPRRGAK
ncbi:MAG: putative lipid II flippase FtsW [Elusimicrobiota bacterium]|jgi:cell division protein FtsW|nr:putative lipid II flippase FtsW [Elusimicrobiota bacterium]